MSNENELELGELQLSALKEVANIGAGHAATALSTMLNCQTMLSVPRLNICPLEKAPLLVDNLAEELVAGVLLKILGDINGYILLLFPGDSALHLPDLLLGREPGTTKELGELELSSLSETANILTCNYLIALSNLLKLKLEPSVPEPVVDMLSAILTSIFMEFSNDVNSILYIETDFEFADKELLLRTFFLLIPDRESLNLILKKLGVL